MKLAWPHSAAATKYALKAAGTDGANRAAEVLSPIVAGPMIASTELVSVRPLSPLSEAYPRRSPALPSRARPGERLWMRIARGGGDRRWHWRDWDNRADDNQWTTLRWRWITEANPSAS